MHVKIHTVKRKCEKFRICRTADRVYLCYMSKLSGLSDYQALAGLLALKRAARQGREAPLEAVLAHLQNTEKDTPPGPPEG